MNQLEKRALLIGAIACAACIGLYLISTVLTQLIILSMIGGTGVLGYLFINKTRVNAVDKASLFKLMEVLNSPSATKAKMILHKYTTNKYYKGDIDIGPAFKDPEEYIALQEFKRQLSFYSSNFTKELVDSGLWKEYIKYDHPLFYVDCDSIPGVSQSVYNKIGVILHPM